MIKLKQSSPNPSGIRFPNDTMRSVSFRAVARPKDAKAKVTYSIQSPGAAFSHNNKTSFTEEIDIRADESTINQSLGFTKTAAGMVHQVVVNARVDEVGGSSGFDVFWVIPVLQAPAKATGGKAMSLTVNADAASAASVEGVTASAASVKDARYPLDRSELESVRRVLLTLQAAVDAALATDSAEFEDIFASET